MSFDANPRATRAQKFLPTNLTPAFRRGLFAIENSSTRISVFLSKGIRFLDLPYTPSQVFSTFHQTGVSSGAAARAIMRPSSTSSAEPGGVETTGSGRARLVFLVVILLLAGVGLWRDGAPEGSFQVDGTMQLRRGLSPDEKMTAYVDSRDLPKALRMYAELTGRELLPSQASWGKRLDRYFNGRLVRWGIVKPAAIPDNGICYHRDGRFSAMEIKQALEDLFRSAGLCPVPEGRDCYRLVRRTIDADTGD